MANTTSGTATFGKGFSISDIVEESFERIGMSGVSGYQLKSARTSLNIMFRSASDGTSDATAIYGVEDVLEASYRNAQNVDFPLTKVGRAEYQSFASKTSKGTPTQYFVQRFIDKITITLFLTPGATEAGNFINYYYVKRIEDAGEYTNDADVPYRFIPCMVAGLAYYLAQKYQPERIGPLKVMYEEELLRALQQDGSPSSTFITPRTYYPNI